MDVPERSLQILAMRQLLSHVHNFPVRGGFTNWSNLGGSLPQSNCLSGIVKREHPQWTLAVGENDVQESDKQV